MKYLYTFGCKNGTQCNYLAMATKSSSDKAIFFLKKAKWSHILPFQYNKLLVISINTRKEFV